MHKPSTSILRRLSVASLGTEFPKGACRFRIRRWAISALKIPRAIAILALLSGMASPAGAAPISAYGGYLDGVLRVYDIQVRDDGFAYLGNVIHDYQLGIDFFPAVPLSFQSSLTPYSACNAGYNWGVRCVTNMSSVLADPFAQDRALPPALQPPLGDGCGGPISTDYHAAGLADSAMVARGPCTFGQKWMNAEAGGMLGLLVAETSAGPIGGVGLVPMSGVEPTIPLFRVTQAVAAEIRTGSPIVNDPRGPMVHTALIEMVVHWTPISTPVPEPPTLLLLIIGLGMIAGAGRRVRLSATRSR